MPLTAPTSSAGYLKAADFNNGVDLVVTKAPEVVDANDPKYGNDQGKTTRYHFQDKDGNDLTFENHGNAFANAFNQAGLEIGEAVHIKRSGEGFSSSYTITKK